MRRIGVVGAGVVGLSCATKIVEVYGNSVDVTVIADKFLEETTSYSCGGLWMPYALSKTESAKINEWGKLSFCHFSELHFSKDAAASGVQLLPCFNLYNETEEYSLPDWKDIVFNFAELTQDTLQKLDLSSRFSRGYCFGTFVADQKYYLPFLTARLKNAGVKFEKRRVTNLQSLHRCLENERGFDIVLNCAGLGSATLVGDNEMYPIRGQVIRVRAPWVNAVWGFGPYYIIPNVDTVVLGGTKQRGDWNEAEDAADTARILTGVSDLLPALREAPVERVWAGLRPGRDVIRLETEYFPSPPRADGGGDGGKAGGLAVVHCYGHGGSGVTLAMGCAADVVHNHLSALLPPPPPASRAARL